MTRWLLGCAAVLAVAALAQAHFIWIVPEQPAGPKAKVLFSDNLKPDAVFARRTDQLAGTEFRVRDAAGKESPLTLGKGDESSGTLEVPGEGPRVVGGKCRWGVHVLKEQNELIPMLLYYYPKAAYGAKVGEPGKAWG